MFTDKLLDIDTFYARAGISQVDANSSEAQALLDDINSAVKDELSYLFSFAPNTEKKIKSSGIHSVVYTKPFQPAGVVDSITVTDGGANHATQPTVAISGDGQGAEAIAIIENGIVKEIKITKQGRGYTVAPTIDITGGGGSGATATATISNLIIEKGSDSSPTTTTLTEGDDYRLIYYDEDNTAMTYPVVGVDLYGLRMVGSDSFIKITGTYGFSPVVPSITFLASQLYDVLKKAVFFSGNEAESGGKGVIVRAKTGENDVTYDASSSGGGLFGATMTTQMVLEETQSILEGIKTKYDCYDSDLLPTILG